jgi:hypothetical protein
MYKIVCKDLKITECYVGHTTNFTDRKRRHKGCCNVESNLKHNLKIYTIIRANGGWDNWSMIEIENFPCDSKRQAESRERVWYELLDAKLNSQIPIILVPINEYKREYDKTYKQTEVYKTYREKFNEERRLKRESIKTNETNEVI